MYSRQLSRLECKQPCSTAHRHWLCYRACRARTASMSSTHSHAIGSATELAESQQTMQAAQSPHLLPLLPRPEMKYEIHVDFNKGMWWAMPHDLSDSILEEWLNGSQQVSFIWDWKESRRGSWQSDGAETSINRYIIDFDTMRQRNIDNERTRKVKVVCILR